MFARLRPTLTIALLCALVAVAWSEKMPAAQPFGSASNDVMSALLQEVHGLRLAMEQSAAIAPRVQLTLARLNIEEQRIAQLAGQFDRARQEVTNMTTSRARMAENLDEAEKLLQTTSDEHKRRELELQIRDLKQQVKMFNATEQAAQTRENEAAQALTTEQNRWNDLNARLDELERLLPPPR